MTSDSTARPRRVVLDTNVLVAAAFSPGGAAARLVALARAGALLVVWSDATRRESERIVRRIPPIRGTTVLDLFTAAGAFAYPVHPEDFAVVVDPDDRAFAALACAADATLVTGDDHLLRARAALPCVVMTARALLEELDG